jgi:hypothetical protein
VITWWVLLGGFVAGLLAAVLAAEVGWLLQRAEDGRGRGRPGEVATAAPPYDWAADEPTDEQIARLVAACPPAEGFEEPDR